MDSGVDEGLLLVLEAEGVVGALGWRGAVF